MKNVLIGGVPRAGKSTLTNLLFHENGFSVLRGERLMSALTPPVAVTPGPGKIPHEQFVNARAPSLLRLLRKLCLHNNIPYVLESNAFSPAVVLEHMPCLAEMATLVFLGYPSLTVQQMLERIHKHAETDKYCMSHEIKGQKLADFTAEWIDRSRENQKQCCEYGYLFVDTGVDFHATLRKAKEEVIRRSRPEKTLDQRKDAYK